MGEPCVVLGVELSAAEDGLLREAVERGELVIGPDIPLSSRVPLVWKLWCEFHGIDPAVRKITLEEGDAYARRAALVGLRRRGRGPPPGRRAQGGPGGERRGGRARGHGGRGCHGGGNRRAATGRGSPGRPDRPVRGAAGARAEVRETFGDIREAQGLGDSLSRLTDAQSELSIELREILMPIKRFVVEQLAGFLETLVDIARAIKGGIDVLTTLIQGLFNVVVDLATGDLFKLGDDIRATIKKIEDVIKDAATAADRERDAEAALLGALRSAAYGPLPPPRNPDPVRNAASSRLFGPGRMVP